MRKLAVRPAAHVLRTCAVRPMSSNLNNKERGEEAMYFQREDERLKAEMKRKMEEILKLHDSDEAKQDLVNLLSSKKKGEEVDKDASLVSKLGLDDWKLAVPVGILLAIPALANEVNECM